MAENTRETGVVTFTLKVGSTWGLLIHHGICSFSILPHHQRSCTSMETSSCGSNRSDSALLCFILRNARRSTGGRAVFFLELWVFPGIIFEGRSIYEFSREWIQSMCFLRIMLLFFSIGTWVSTKWAETKKINKSWIYSPPRMPQVLGFATLRCGWKKLHPKIFSQMVVALMVIFIPWLKSTKITNKKQIQVL